MIDAFVGLIREGVFMQVAGATVLTGPLFTQIILPFVLVFTILFALLQKSQILGKDKRQIDAIVSLVLALIVISFANAVGIITSLIPFLAVSVVIILVFLILWSMVFQGEDDRFKINKGLKIALGIIIGIAVVVAVLIATGAWDYIRYEWIYAGDSSALFTNIIFVVIVIVAIAIVVWPGKKEDK